MEYRTMTEEQSKSAFEGEGGLVRMEARGIPHITQETSEETARKLRAHTPIQRVAELLDSLKDKGTSIAAEVNAERVRQNVKFTGSPVGVQRHSAIGWSSILGEESGEVQRASNDLYWPGGEMSEEDLKAKLAHLRYECIQTMAVSQAIIERIDGMDPALVSPEGTYQNEPYPARIV